jgi:ATP-dependent helicase/nuclease subunit A
LRKQGGSMAKKKIQWTDQQKRAITASGSDVLVTASAGTGKTAVLSGRCIHILSGKSDVRNFLILTFTDAAAEQMRQRIAQQLQEAFLEKPDNHLRYQLILLQGAEISTIHAFCKRLITEYFYKLDLDPTFGIIDSDEQRLLKTEALEETIDWAWQQGNLQFGLEHLLFRRSLHTNNGFLSKIIQLSDFLDGIVSRRNWYERASKLAEITSLQTTSLGEKQKLIIENRLKDILDRLRHAQNLSESSAENADWAEKLEESHVMPVVKCLTFLKNARWDECAKAIRNYIKPKTYKPKDLPEEIAELIRKTTKSAIDDFEKLSQFAVVNPEYLDRLSGSAGLQTKILIELVRQFDVFYNRAKRKINCLDFADLEHYALKLLTDENSPDDEPRPSPTALSLRQKYLYIFVDEYQDINSVQQRILEMLSPGGNVLQVGDIKQSIYAFRGAEPEIFLEQLKHASSDIRSSSGGLRVDLNANFRSVKGILDFVNKIFSRIMTASFSGFDYDQSARLKPAPIEESSVPATDDNDAVVEFYILDETNRDAEEQDEQTLHQSGTGQIDESENADETNLVTSRRRQAAMIAQRIRQMVGTDTGRAQFQINDKQQDCMRDVEYRDIVILMRSLAKKANDYVEVLRLAGVPVSCQATAGYFQATEISDCLALLKVLDNPQRDIELASVLRSPFFKVTDSELAKIKIHSREKLTQTNYYHCVLEYSKSGGDEKLTIKLNQILIRIEQWRTIARRGSLADLIWRIYRETGYLSFVSALPNGQSRRANLLKLHDRAIQFEGFASSSGIPSLTRFVEFVEKLQEAGQDWAPAEPPSSAGNAVRILSVHKSKGLEFPVVFLAELESPFNKKDIQADCLVNAEDTLGLQIIDPGSNGRLSTLAHQVIAEQKLSKALAEEMRILYVATTRARDRLVLTASQKQTNCRQVISTGLLIDNQALPDWQLRNCRNPLEWILLSLSDQKVLHEAFETGLSSQAISEDLFNFRLYNQMDLKQLSEFVVSQKTGKLKRKLEVPKRAGSKKAAKKLLENIKNTFSWNYLFGDSPELPAKSSVTALTHRNDEFIRFDYSHALDRLPHALKAAETDLGETIEPRLIGTATHLVISRLDLTTPVTEAAVTQRIEELVAVKAITVAAAEQINNASIVAFFKSELGQLLFDTDNKVLREWPFTFALPCTRAVQGLPACDFNYTGNELYMMSDETIIVQGIIDLLVQTPKGLVIIDFKTDHVTAGQTSERAELYRRQLGLYGRAASAIMKTQIISRWLYFLTPGISIEV